MKYNRTTAKDKWTIMMYMRDFDLMATYAYALRASNRLSDDNIDDILSKMEQEGIYRPRNGGSIFTGQFKSIQIAWYMFGYYNKSRNKNEEKKMVFSPLGNLLLDNLKDKKKVAKIFTCMLFGNGFHQPYSQMSADFNIYAFRLVFKLLRDPRLSGKLYNDEMFYLTMFLKTINATTYDELVFDILELRNQDCKQKLNDFKKNERVIGLACHEWRYAIGMLESAGIVNIHEGVEIGKLMYGNISKQTGLPNAVRSYTKGYVTLRTELIDFIDTMLANYPYYEKPYSDDILSSKFIDLCVKDMHKVYSDTTSVMDFVKSKVESEIDKTGSLNLSGLLNLGFVEQAYNLGKRNYKLYAPYSEDTAENYKALQLIYRIIEAVVNCDSQQRMFFYAQMPESDWIYNEKGEMLCGNCGEQNFELVKYNYCPECGAKMKGDSENEESGSINTGTV